MLESMGTLSRDVRFAIRSLRRDLGATCFAVAIAGLGIGASTTVFSLCHALLFRPLPFTEPERLVWIANGTSENVSSQTVQVVNLQELAAQSRSFAAIAGFSPFYGPGDVRVTGGGVPERLTAVPVTQNFFPVVGVAPVAGRTFDDTESRFGSPKTAVLDHGFWQRRFAGDPAVVGERILLDGEPVTVVGVLPASFDFAATFTPGRRADVFVPFPLSPETNRRGNTLALVGRLADGVDLEAARSEARLVVSRFPEGALVDGRQRNGFDPRLTPLRERVSGRFATALYVLAGAVAFLMALVCANLSNLLLVRASTRRREIAVRAALGAARRHLIRQTLVESLLVGVAGAVLGLLVAVSATRLVSHIEGTTIPLLGAVRIDGMVLAFAAGVAVLASVLCGMVPAVQASSGLALPTLLAEGARGSTGRGGAVRQAIVIVEVALVCVLLTGAGLLARSLERVVQVQPGFDPANVITLRVDPQRAGSTFAGRTAYFDELLRGVGSVAGVEAAGLTDALPLGDNYGWRRWSARTGEAPAGGDQTINPLVRMIDEGYLAAMGIPLRAGRAFTAADDTTREPVIIINDRLAERLWPGRDAIGRVVNTSEVDRRVVGVVASVRYFGLDREPDDEMYLPMRQTGDYASIDLVVRSTLPLAALAPTVRAALRRVDPSLPTGDFRAMEDLVDHSVFARRFVVRLVAGFAAFGLILASLGIYAVIAYSVSQRTQEIGIRMALGATPGVMRSHVLGETGLLVAAGAAAGLPASWLAARAIRGLLYDVGSYDPATFAAVALVLAAAAALAGYLPARRATRVDPAIALRPR